MPHPDAPDTPRPSDAADARGDATNQRSDATNDRSDPTGARNDERRADSSDSSDADAPRAAFREAADARAEAADARGEATSARRAALHAAAVVAGYGLFCVAFFAPVLFSERLLAPGDGMLYFVPSFYAHRGLWDNSIWGGHPAVGDSQSMAWYPPALLFSLLGSWHAFLVSAYVLACSFAYGYAHAVTRSRLAAAVAGTTYGMGGFLVAHAGHAALVHAAAWTPALVFSLEMLRGARDGRRRAFWLAAAALSTACAALAGHPQIFAYTLLLAAVYALARGPRAAGHARPDEERARPDDEQTRRADDDASLAEERTRSIGDDAGRPRHDARRVEDHSKPADERAAHAATTDATAAPAKTNAAVASGATDESVASVSDEAVASVSPDESVAAISSVTTISSGGAWRGRLSYYFACAVAVALGVGAACVQLLPTAELARESLRASIDFREFVSYSLPLRQTPMLLFPYLFGGSPGTIYDRAYFGAWGSEIGGWGAGELSGYAGLLPLLLAGVGFLKSRRRRLAWLWLAVGTVAFLLALGDKTPLAWLAYRLPVLNKFRVPARHYLELTLAISALAALGVRALQERAATARLCARLALALACVMIACLLGFGLFAEEINAWAAPRLARPVSPVSFEPWDNPATGIPLLVLAAASAALLLWRRAPHSRARTGFLLVVLALDLASFTWFYEWHYAAPPRDYLRAPASAAALRDELARTHARLLPARGGTGRVAELPPNLSKLWGYPSASGYGPFLLARASRLLGMPPHGSTDAWNDPANLGPDLLAARYLLVPRDAAPGDAHAPSHHARASDDQPPAPSNDTRTTDGARTTGDTRTTDGATGNTRATDDTRATGDARAADSNPAAPSGDTRAQTDDTTAPSGDARESPGVARESSGVAGASSGVARADGPITPSVKWSREDANVVVGRGCGAADSDSFRVELPRAVAADSLALVSALACSVQLADGAEVARLVLTDAEGRAHAVPILAGRDTSEWASDCADVRPHLRHRRAQIFRSRAAVREGGVRCEGHDFVARLALPGGPRQIKAVEIRWAGTPAALAVKKLTLADEAARASTPVDLTPDTPDESAGGGGPLADASRWRRVAEIDAAGYGPAVRPEDAGASVVYENLRALPRAWLVAEVLRVTEDEALAAARTSRLPGGRPFDPTRLALVEEPVTLEGRDAATTTAGDEATATARDDADVTARDGATAAGTAKVVELSDDVLEVETDATAAALLVTSDAYYEGWRATVDGRPARVVRANYLLRGLAVPPGRHRVRFEFAPASFRYGAALSLASLALLAACALLLARRTATP
jgi:Bacterial membrane protein YfhO